MTEVRTYRQLRFTRPPGACELLLVRHGESVPARDDQPFPLVDGQGDRQPLVVAVEGPEQVGVVERDQRSGVQSAVAASELEWPAIGGQALLIVLTGGVDETPAQRHQRYDFLSRLIGGAGNRDRPAGKRAAAAAA